MSLYARSLSCRRLYVVFCFVINAVAFQVVCAATREDGGAARPVKGLMFNDDCTNFFVCDPIPAGKAGELIDRHVDAVAAAGVKIFLCNTNARRTNYTSRVWDAFWDGYDPSGPDDQPFLAPVSKKTVSDYRKWIDNMLAVHNQGIDYPGRVIARCRRDGMSPWISLRMNDCHENNVLNHPMHGMFWQKNPQFFRKNCKGYFARCLDYAHPQVRDFFKALIVETLDRYDIDGLELDFMREPYLFSADKEAEGRPVLTAWLREIRKLTDDAAAKRGHPIWLGVRVPSRPEVAFAWGLDAIGWAKEGLIDLLVATPRWATLEFDMPLQQWRQELGTSKVTLAGGLEVLYRPQQRGAAVNVSPSLALGAAVMVLSSRADCVYLFNYFPGTFPKPSYQETLRAMNSLDTLLKQPRTVAITYRDITAPGEKYNPPLPAKGKELLFPMRLGPMPGGGWQGDILLEFASKQGVTMPLPKVFFDGAPCEPGNDEATAVHRVIQFKIPGTVLKVPALSRRGDSHIIKVTSANDDTLTVRRVEVSFEQKERPRD